MQTENHGITLLMSHLACAEIAGHPLNAGQIKLFRDVRSLYLGVPASLANSSGIFLGDAAQFDMARPGAALYGINPTPGRPNPMRGVVELTGRILQVRNVARGETVGYGATWTAKRASRIAVAALGYADGLIRAASGSDGARGGAAMIAGKLCPFAGRISMDLVCIDITDLAEGVVQRGDIATFIGEGISVDEVAAAAGTIGYEILTRLGPRCHLVYRGGLRWRRAHKTSSVKTAARPLRAGPAAAKPAASGIRWSRKAPRRRRVRSRKGRLFAIEPLKGQAQETPRLASGIAEFDRVTGGGLVRGSVLLLGGDPGIGKSTLLIEVAAAFARSRHRAVYISGEEAVAQVRLRAERLGLADARGRARRRNLGRGHRRDAVARPGAAPARDRFDPDHVDADASKPRPAR